MNNADFEQTDQERLRVEIAKQLGLSVQELKTWMISDLPRETEQGQPAGHTVVFRESTPSEILQKLKNRDSEYTAHTDVLPH